MGAPGAISISSEVTRPKRSLYLAGHQVLEKSGRRHEWGVGRHILGSQIFDYWRDPWGHTVEHWTDGDLFNNETPPNVVGIDKLMGNQWGPEAPPSMGS